MKRNKVLFVIAIVAMLAVLFVACDNSQPEHTHTYGAWTIATAPTETDAGTATRVCSCGNVETATVAKLGDASVWSVKTSQDATHTSKGYKVYESAYGTVTVEVAKGEHAYGAWTITTEPTATEAGKAIRVCVCGSYEEVALAVLTDTSVWTKKEKQAQSHTEDGIVEYTSEYGKVTVTTAKAGHTYGAWTLTTEPTETAAGVATRVCSCGDKQTQPVAKLTDTSVWTVSVNQESSHTQGGVKVYTSVYGTIIKTSGQGTHTYGSWEITTDPTEETTGVAKRYCSCGFFEQVTIPALSNSIWTRGENSATHFEPGKVTYTSEYGTVTIITEVQQHVYGAWESNGNGTHTHKCVSDDHKETKDCAYNQQVATAAYLAQAATCDSPAKYYYSCVCGTKSEHTFTYGGALGHNYDNFQVTEATCTEDGAITATCTREGCGHVYNKTIEKLGHDHEGGCIAYENITGDEETQEDGSEHHVYRCSRCGAYDTENIEEHRFGESVEYVLSSGTQGWHSVNAVSVCEDCGRTKKEDAFDGNYVESDFFTKGDVKEADYNEAGYVEYTYKKTNTTFRIVEPKLTAPYEGVTYYAYELSQRENESVVKVNYFNTTVTFDENGNGTGNASPFKGVNVIRITDKNTGAVTFTRVDGSSTYSERGYIDLSTGIVVMTKGSVYDSVYFMIPSTYSIKAEDVNGAVWTDSMAISYDAVCAYEFKHGFNFFVYDETVYFGAKYFDAEGNEIKGADCATANYVQAVDAQNNKIQTFARNASGALQVTDGLEGSYTDSTYNAVVLNGVGGATIDGKAGVYFKATDKDYYELYVGESVEAATEYYTFVIADDEISVTKPTATLTFDAAAEGITVANVDVNINIATVLPTPAERADYVFKGWKLNGEGEEMKSFKATTADMTYNFVASWAKSSQLTVKGLIADDEAEYGSKVIGYGDTYVSALPNYKYQKTFNEGYTFAGWVLDTNDNKTLDDEDEDIQDEDVVTADGADLMIFATWEWAGEVSFTEQTGYTFVYDYENGYWASNNQGKGSSSATMEFVATAGIANVSFEYMCSSESSYDVLTIWYGPKASTSVTMSGTSNSWKTIATTLDFSIDDSNQKVRFTYSKDSSGDKGDDTAYIRNLRINGVLITAQNALFKNAGTYTNGGNEIQVSMGGTLTIGENNYSYTTVSDTVIGATIEGVYKEFTLDTTAKTYTETEPQVTVTYNYNGHGTNSSEQVGKYSTVTLPTDIASVDGLLFEGWYTDVELTAKATDTVVASSDITFYAKWVEPSPFEGTYAIVYLTSSGVSSVYVESAKKLVIDGFGKTKVSSYNGFSYGASVEFAFAKDSTSVMTITIDSSTINYGIYDATTGIIVRSTYESSISENIYLMIPYNENYVKADFSTMCWTIGTKYHKIISFADRNATENADRTIFVADQTSIAFDATWTAVNASDESITALSDVKSNADMLTVVSGDKTYKFAKNTSSNFVVTDGNEGTYTSGSDSVRLNGAGKITGTFNGTAISGTYTTAASTANYGFDVKATVSGATCTYTLSINKDDNTYTMAENRVTITYVNDKVTVASASVFRNVYTSLVKDGLTVDGFRFSGWFDNAAYSGYSKTGITPTEDVTFYAKYDKAVTLTFDYSGYEYEAGKTTYVVSGKYATDKVSGIPTVASTVRYKDQAFAGWFLKNEDGSFGAEASTSTVLTDDLTYYAKWIDPHFMTGTYKGYSTYTYTSGYSLSSVTLVVDIFGKTSGARDGGEIVDYNEETGYFYIQTSASTKFYAYYDSVNKVIVMAYSSGADAFGKDAYYLFLTDETVSGSKDNVVRWNNNTAGLLTFTVGTAKRTVYIDNDKVYCDVTVSDSNGTIDVTSAIATDGKVITIKKGDTTIETLGYLNGTFVKNDGKEGSYNNTSDDAYGVIYLNGYGTLTVGGKSVLYSLDGNKVTFVANNAMRIITLGDGTYTKTLDGYEGTYTLPDGTSTITLDGYGNAGDGKTYVVDGTNITIYDGETSTAYGLDVANKVLLGKSVFAGYTFTGTYYDDWDKSNNAISFVFDDSSQITGTLVVGYNGTYKAKFTATFDGTKLVITITENVANASDWVGKTLEATLSGQTFTITSWYKTSGTYTFANKGTLTCSTFGA